MPDPICDTCNDTGWKDQRQRSLDPIPCPDCSEEESAPRPANKEEWVALLAHLESAITICQEQRRALSDLEYALDKQYGAVCRAGYGP